ncbi:hypothetical protein [Chondrinema litorale]|uniref:hypothetical protein n=1 Tax=Chondrinema litorale TaxID=2994555 RepID=UPI0025434A5A|nr:hypothetical protein [Chondrinema litorale]UZR96993.1 hypothetical protein OQ292_23120 [Chondrinema litorale]
MKLVQINFILFIIYICATPSYSQIAKAYRFAFNPTGESTAITDFHDPNVNNLDGSPYYSETNEWQNGLIYFDDAEAPEHTLLRYNLMSDLVEVKMAQDSFFLDNSKIHKFKIIDENGEYSLYFQNGFTSSDNNIKKNNYFEILYTGKSKLVVDYQSEIKVADTSFGATRAMASSGATPRDKIVHKKVYYLYKPDGILYKLPLKKKNFLEEMGAKQDEISSYLKENKYKISNPEDLVEVISYYDTLL